MTIDAMKIIPKLSVLLEEWEKLKEIRNWGALIRETYSGIMWGVAGFIDSATYKLQTDRTTNGMWDVRIYGSKIKRSVWNNYYISYSRRSSNRSYYLEPRLKTNCKEMNYYVPIQQDEAYE